VKRIIGWLHVEPLLAVVLWGGIYPGVKLGLRDIPVLSFTYLRLLLAMAVLFLVSGSVQAFILRRPLWKPLLSAGLAACRGVVGAGKRVGAVRALGADRIAHGIRAVEDPELLAYLAKHHIGCDVCPTSNVCLGIYPSLEHHPIRRLLAAGVPVTLNSDDPPLFHTTLTDEFLNELSTALCRLPLSIRQSCPDPLILGHCSRNLTSAQRFTIREHYIVCTARDSRLCIRSAAFPTGVKEMLARTPYPRMSSGASRK